MPTTLPGSFASAAAGNNNDVSARPFARGEAGTSADWTRRPNGATQTFRRSSTNIANAASTSQRDSHSNTWPAAAYVPPRISASRGSGSTVDTRYSKAQLLDLFKEQRETGDLDDDVADLYVGDSLAGLSNGIPAPKWSRREESKSDYAAPGPEVCWDPVGSAEPLGLIEMSEEEKELFATSVNSPLKGPNQSVPRDSTSRDAGVNRKISVSHSPATTHGFGLVSPTAGRVSNRRRDTSDSYPLSKDLATTPPTTSATMREEASEAASSFGLLRRRPDTLEASSDRYNEEDGDKVAEESDFSSTVPSLASFKRSATNPLITNPSTVSFNWPSASQSSDTPTLSAFRNLGFGTQTASQAAKRSDVAPSRESRFRGLMNKAKIEANEQGLQDMQSMGSIGKSDNTTQRQEASRGGDNAGYAGSRPQRLDDEQLSGEQEAIKDHSAYRDLEEHHILEPNTGVISQGRPQSSVAPEEPLSPTFTNPYSSPQQQKPGLRDMAPIEPDLGSLHLPGLGEYQKQGLHEASGTGPYTARRDLNRAQSYDLRQPDRSQFSTSTTSRGFPSLGVLSGLGGFGNSEPWSTGPSAATPSREQAQFADFGGQIAGSVPGLHSPSIRGADTATPGRDRRLGSLFPTAMQEQMRTEAGRSQRDERSLPVPLENLDSSMRTSGSRGDLDSPFRFGGHGKFDEFYSSGDVGQSFHGHEATLSGESLNPSSVQPSAQPPNFSQPSQKYSTQVAPRTANVNNGPSSQPPTAQQKTMVMPDRIRWIYRDPQGNTQGPWSGLEMHDWYRAGFFSPELLVKKAEDADYEPLAQLIRRIGNSREPFLVPQIGIPGPPSSQPNNNWPGQNMVSSPSTAVSAAVAQPPFAGSFPSFGTTLTAEQQNALERRKQEEQYLMARQKEHLAQQQLHVRQMQGQHGVHQQQQQLQHHSSAQSLQSQPSYGSMTSPNGFQASPPQGITHMSAGVAGGFEGSFRLGGGISIGPIGSGIDNLGHIREEESSGLIDRVNMGQDSKGIQDTQRLVGHQQFQDADSFEERTAMMLADRVLIERQQAEGDQLLQARDQTHDPLVNERLREFQDLRNTTDSESYQGQLSARTKEITGDAQNIAEGSSAWQAQSEDILPRQGQDEFSSVASRSLSLTEQVQKAASSKATPVTSSWAKVDSTLPDSTLPPQSTSPLPAPAARRGRTNVADTLAAESISQSQSPADETPTSSVAPWAKEYTETQKQPSLREIQEVEARKAAKLEEIAAASRRAQLERETANQVPPPAPGLPLSSTWGSSESPVSASTAGQFAWTKPIASRAATVSNTPAKKSLQQIQAEEEAAARKKKASASANSGIASHVASVAQAMSSGKRYADLAGKAASPVSAAVGAWTTVGASGKPKGPVIAPTLSTVSKTSSNPTVTNAATSGNAKPKSASSSSKTSLAVAKQNAQDELKKWATAELRPDLDKDIQVEEFVQTLLNFPPDTDMITEVVHQNSSTIDSRHFAEEFVRRRGLAEKGKTDSTPAAGSHHAPQASEAKGGGWNEVARKSTGVNANMGTTKDEASGAFKIVTAKKKGKR